MSSWVKDSKDNVVKLINSITGVKTIKGNQNAPRPNGDYITVLLSTSLKEGEEYITGADEVGDITMTSNRDLSFSLNCISEDAVQILEDLKRDIKRESNLQKLRDAELAYVNSGNVLDTSAGLGDNYIESRASLDLFLRTAIVDVDNVGIIEKVSGKATFVQSDGSTSEAEYQIPPS